ncbi:hypothetical protein BKA70DRAFT_1234145 [Coprinopsis sp. MPI-PUGE-AT-0042]|nr:hypothetical protein BKA70DRAFT_1234145 [Coprinopsis sp. MPI-PUGE-AT-0042]
MPCHRATVGYYRPPQSPDSQPRSASASTRELSHFLRQIHSARFRTAHSPAQILHWDYVRDGLREWAWPSDSDNGERIPPSELENHCRTHFFTAPCCLCTFSLGETLVESRIGLVVVAPDGESSKVVGECVAQCASKQCGYFVPLERFYARKVLKVKGYQKRATPLAPEQLSYICDVAPTHGEPGGLAHVIPASMIWSKGTRTCNVVWPLDLPEAPENINSDVSSSGDTEIINEHSSDDDTDDETDDEMPPLEDIEP